MYVAMSGLKRVGQSLEELRSALDDIFSHPMFVGSSTGRPTSPGWRASPSACSSDSALSPEH